MDYVCSSLGISYTVLYNIISGDLVYNNLCARWVPWIFIKKHKQNWRSCTDFPQSVGQRWWWIFEPHCYWWHDLNFLYHSKNKMQCHHSPYPTKSKKANQILSNRKCMTTVFLDQKGVLIIDYMPIRETINLTAYCKTS